MAWSRILLGCRPNSIIIKSLSDLFSINMTDYRFVNFSWDDAQAAQLDPVGRLVYRSNLLGADQRITNTGGGNTSAKITDQDPLTGRKEEVLWVKGSGGDLRT